MSNKKEEISKEGTKGQLSSFELLRLKHKEKLLSSALPNSDNKNDQPLPAVETKPEVIEEGPKVKVEDVTPKIEEPVVVIPPATNIEKPKIEKEVKESSKEKKVKKEIKENTTTDNTLVHCYIRKSTKRKLELYCKLKKKTMSDFLDDLALKAIDKSDLSELINKMVDNE